MSDLIVLAFDSEDGAKNMLNEIGRLQKQQIITLEDAAYVVRKQDGKPKIKQANSLVGAGALGGAFWGLLIGLLFFAPWLGMVAGALGGAIGGKLTDFGIDYDFIKEVGDTVEPGHSALFLLVAKSTPDKLEAELSKFEATVLQTSLSEEDEAKLRATFHHEEEDES